MKNKFNGEVLSLWFLFVVIGVILPIGGIVSVKEILKDKEQSKSECLKEKAISFCEDNEMVYIKHSDSILCSEGRRIKVR